ncbi:hypothetical protein OG978_44305 (plasmid) [Streptomyces sp. NBC_01591]|nr:hypothetical protein [Streptomyces sp. NBC_01591]WSD74146.1 hypothetical protein OG978_44305 [Streptomyces sp. NBC_01591]
MRRHLDWFAAKGAGGLLFVGGRDAPFRRSIFDRTCAGNTLFERSLP